MASNFWLDEQFSLGNLPTDLLEGVMQRVHNEAKKQLELVDQRFAVVAHRLAWRHYHHHIVKIKSGSVVSVDVGPFSVKAAETTAAARFLDNRSTIQHVEFYNISIGSIYASGTSVVHIKPDSHQEQWRGVLAVLLSSERVVLHSLLLHQTPKDLFGDSEQLVALIQRHYTTLHEVSLRFCDEQPPKDVGDALSICPDLHKLTAFVDNSSSDLWQQPLRQLTQSLQLSCLTICGVVFLQHWPSSLAGILLAPTLLELRLKRFGVLFSADEDWSMLANLCILETEQCPWLSEVSSQEEANRVFSAVLPRLDTLIISSYVRMTTVYWSLLTKLVAAFLNRAGDGSLSVELPVRGRSEQERCRPLTEWHANFPQLSVEYLDTAQRVQPRPTLPDEFNDEVVSVTVVLGRPNEARRITITVCKLDRSR